MHAILKRMVKEARTGKIVGAHSSASDPIAVHNDNKLNPTQHTEPQQNEFSPNHQREQKNKKYQLNVLCVPKTNAETGKKSDIRVARHGSFRTRDSVAINDIIIPEMCTMDLPNVQEYTMRLENEKVAAVVVRDLKDAFRQLKTRKSDIGTVRYTICGYHFIDHRQSYGLSSAAANCQRFGELLIWILEHHYLSEEQRGCAVVHIDDFMITARSIDEALEIGAKFDKMCSDLGVLISHEKSETGITTGIVHGFEFDLKSKTVSIPPHKLTEIRHGLQLMIKYRMATGRALESICGKMMHWSQFRKQTKVLCHRIMKQIHMKIRNKPRYKRSVFVIQPAVIKDFTFWLRTSSMMTQIPMTSVIHQPSISIVAATDACNKGGGFIIGPHYGHYLFSDRSESPENAHKYAGSTCCDNDVGKFQRDFNWKTSVDIY